MKPETEKIAELKQKKRQMQEEIDELEGNTTKGKLIGIGVFLLVLTVGLGIFAGMIKTDVGGFAGNVLAPLISDVPVLRSILPKQMQEKSASELAAEQAKTEAQTAAAPAVTNVSGAAGSPTAADVPGTSESPATTDVARTSGPLAAANISGNTADTADTAAAKELDTATKVQDYVDTYSTMDPADVAKIFENMMPDQGELAAMIFQKLPASQRSGILSGMSTDNAVWLTEQTSPLPPKEKSAEELAAEQEAESTALIEQEKAAEEAALQDYVDTYSTMKPQDAAQIFDSIMPQQSELVTKILEKLTVDQRANILSQMSVENAAVLTIKMQK